MLTAPAEPIMHVETWSNWEVGDLSAYDHLGERKNYTHFFFVTPMHSMVNLQTLQTVVLAPSVPPLSS